MARQYKDSNSIKNIEGRGKILYFIAFCICTLAFFMYFHVRTHIFTCELSKIWFFSDEKSNSKQQEYFFGRIYFWGWGTAWKSNKMFIRATCTSNCSCLWSAIERIFFFGKFNYIMPYNRHYMLLCNDSGIHSTSSFYVSKKKK